VAIYILSSGQCTATAPACLAGADSYPSNDHPDDTETARYDNRSDAPLEVLLGIEAATLGPPGAFTVSVAFAPIVVVDAGVLPDALAVDATLVPDAALKADAAPPADAALPPDAGTQ
jgi:hypothetical protein